MVVHGGLWSTMVIFVRDSGWIKVSPHQHDGCFLEAIPIMLSRMVSPTPSPQICASSSSGDWPNLPSMMTNGTRQMSCNYVGWRQGFPEAIPLITAVPGHEITFCLPTSDVAVESMYWNIGIFCVNLRSIFPYVRRETSIIRKLDTLIPFLHSFHSSQYAIK